METGLKRYADEQDLNVENAGEVLLGILTHDSHSLPGLASEVDPNALIKLGIKEEDSLGQVIAKIDQAIKGIREPEVLQCFENTYDDMIEAGGGEELMGVEAVEHLHEILPPGADEIVKGKDGVLRDKDGNRIDGEFIGAIERGLLDLFSWLISQEIERPRLASFVEKIDGEVGLPEAMKNIFRLARQELSEQIPDAMGVMFHDLDNLMEMLEGRMNEIGGGDWDGDADLATKTGKRAKDIEESLKAANAFIRNSTLAPEIRNALDRIDDVRTEKLSSELIAAIKEAGDEGIKTDKCFASTVKLREVDARIAHKLIGVGAIGWSQDSRIIRILLNELGKTIYFHPASGRKI